MKVISVSTATGAEATQRASGVMPYSFPPLDMNKFDPKWLEGADLLYIHLHGMPDQPYWYGDHLDTAISAEQIKRLNLAGVVSFVANCYGAGSRMLEALLEAGCSAVIAGPGTNYTVEDQVRGADKLGAEFIKAYSQDPDRDVGRALVIAKDRIRLLSLVSPWERDALEFKIYIRGST